MAELARDHATHCVVGWPAEGTRDEARRDLFAYIEGYYNRQRIHSALGYITPEQAERKAS